MAILLLIYRGFSLRHSVLFFDGQTNAQPNENKIGPYYDSGNFSYSFASQLLTLPWPDTDDEINDIFYRFFYSHIFGKTLVSWRLD